MICDVPPFKYQSVPQPNGESGSSSNQINEQALEGYIQRLLSTLCVDISAINARLTSLEDRVTALEP